MFSRLASYTDLYIILHISSALILSDRENFKKYSKDIIRLEFQSFMDEQKKVNILNLLCKIRLLSGKLGTQKIFERLYQNFKRFLNYVLLIRDLIL